MSQGEKSQGEMSQGRNVFREKCRTIKKGVVATGCNVFLKSIYLLQQIPDFLVSWSIIRNSKLVKFDSIFR